MRSTRYEIRDARYEKAFTLVELLVAMIVTSIVLTTVATLAFALGRAIDVTDDSSLKQAQVRFASLRIQELIRYSRMICFAGNEDLALWRADENNDGMINIGELVYIEWGPDRDHLQICEFNSSNNSAINLDSIGAFATNWWAAYGAGVDYTQVMPQCSNVRPEFDVMPPQSKFISITFDFLENDIVRQCEITGKIRSWAGNVLDAGIITCDDD